jgi:hypothetical protein
MIALLMTGRELNVKMEWAQMTSWLFIPTFVFWKLVRVCARAHTHTHFHACEHDGTISLMFNMKSEKQIKLDSPPVSSRLPHPACTGDMNQQLHHHLSHPQ